MNHKTSTDQISPTVKWLPSAFVLFPPSLHKNYITSIICYINYCFYNLSTYPQWFNFKFQCMLRNRCLHVINTINNFTETQKYQKKTKTDLLNWLETDTLIRCTFSALWSSSNFFVINLRWLSACSMGIGSTYVELRYAFANSFCSNLAFRRRWLSSVNISPSRVI